MPLSPDDPIAAQAIGRAYVDGNASVAMIEFK
jgi:hypothetical protein